MKIRLTLFGRLGRRKYLPFAQLPIVLKNGYNLLKSNDPLLLSSSTAFFTTFALPPIIIILTDILKLFFPKELVTKELFSKVQMLLGRHESVDIRSIVNNFQEQETNMLLTILITIFFYFVATTLLNAIKQAIHQLWGIARNQDKVFRYSLKERLTGIGMMFMAAALVVFAYIIDFAFREMDPESLVIIALQRASSVAIISIWFALIFKLIPEARIHWLVAIAGGTFTGILFTGGELLLGKFIGHGKLAVIFGVSSTMALLLLFIFYCSFTLYFGAAVTYEFAKAIGAPIKPGKYGVRLGENVGSL